MHYCVVSQFHTSNVICTIALTSSRMSLITTNLVLDVLGLFFIIAGSIFLYFKWTYGYWKRKGITYVEPSFPFGNMGNPVRRKHALGILFKMMHEKLKAKGCKYGGIFSIFRPVLVVIDPEMVRSILTKNFQHFTDRGLYTNEEVDPLSGHLFLLNGTKWRNLRVKLTPTFTSGKMKTMFAIMAECSNQLLEKVGYYDEQQMPLDIKEVLACFTTDVIGSAAFGLECNSFNEDDSVFRKYGRKLLNPTPAQIIRTTFIITFPKLSGFLGIKQMSPDTENFFMNMVKDTVEYREKTKFTRNDFMQLLINLKNQEADGSNLTINEIAAQAFVFFFAGFETSSTAMTFCLYELATHPEIQEKVREEVNRVLKQHQGVVSYDAIQEMKYLGQVLDGKYSVVLSYLGLTLGCGFRNVKEVSAFTGFT